MRILSRVPAFNFLGASRRRLAVAVSVLAIIASIVALAIPSQRLALGIDFSGGIELEVAYPAAADLDAIRTQLTGGGYPDAIVQNFGSADRVLVRLPPEESANGTELRQRLLTILSADGTAVDLRRVDFVGPQVGRELTEAGGLATIFTLLMIFVYVMFRFQWRFAAGAVAALAHDVIVTIGFFSITQIQFDLTVLAALLAVIGYSLNDTVVVFDRIRENFLTLRGKEPEEVMNISINQMLARTIITGVTTLVVLLALFFLGGEAIQPFSIALIVGIIVGTYSSIYVASATALALGVSAKDLMPPEIPADEIDDMP
ncbi:MAG: protein translocase subunit SecF [Pseudomonadota bacterium]